jgi:N-acetylglucosaminyl-diphospho-decaprenol L-rhamnosyltransferase
MTPRRMDATSIIPATIEARLSPTQPWADPAAVVSVCIVNWNCRDLLRDCLTSLLDRPQGVTFEVIVIDNASTDGAADMVAAAFPTVRLFRNPANLGFSRANNQAAAVAKGEYFFFLNNDTVVPAMTLSRLTQYARSHPNVGMIGPRLVGVNGDEQISYRRKPTLDALFHRIGLLRWTGLYRKAYYDYRRQTFHPDGIKTVEALMGAAVFLPRAAFEKSGRWDEKYPFGGEDLDLSAQVGQHHQVVYHGHVTVVHYGRVSSRSNAGYVTGNVAIGYVHYFRKAGEKPRRIALYKLLVALDAPIQFTIKCGQGLVRRLLGRKAEATKSFESARGFGGFIKNDLLRFWRS